MISFLMAATAITGELACATTPSSDSTAGQPPPGDGGPGDALAASLDGGVDPYLWLEDVTGERALTWVRAQNQRSTGELEAAPSFAPLKGRLLQILDSKEKIPYVSKRGRFFYNFWRDEAHPRGLWRRVPSLAEYKKPKPAWETVLDIDALAASEKENWVLAGIDCLYPKYERCLVKLSRGGADANVVREFDVVKKAFVDGGFVLPEAKSRVGWIDQDTLFVATDFGPGTLTDSGYPRLVKVWKRGTPLASATLLLEGKPSDMMVSASRIFDHGRPVDLAVRTIDFYSNEYWLAGPSGLAKLELPASAEIEHVWEQQLVFRLRDDWTLGATAWPKGSLLAVELAAFRAGKRDFTALFTPSENSALAGSAGLKSSLLVTELVDVRKRLAAWSLTRGTWTKKPVDLGARPSFDVSAVDDTDGDDAWLIDDDFIVPSTFSVLSLAKAPERLKQSPAFFDAKGLEARQHFATSKDGTRVPYFIVSKKGLVYDGQNPTLLTGYGGFEISLEAHYAPLVGAGWLERGGVFVQANIRGGGEYGPRWHQAALKHRRQAAYDDFIAVAEDLMARKVTSPARLGIEGGSNGGLLVGVMLTQRPELFGAVVCAVPLLDMKRFSKLLAGASWMAEYGDPEKPDDWAVISRYSPYQNVKPGAKYPRTLFLTSTRDDRVHPGHARKMVARMSEWKHDVVYYENIEGGHGGAANNEQRAYMKALTFTFLARQLGLGAAPSPSPSR